MKSLANLLTEVTLLPTEELRTHRIEERPNEMKVLSQIFSPEEIESFRRKKVYVRRKCSLNGRGPEIHFNVAVGEATYMLVITKECVTSNGKPIEVSTLKEFREYITNLGVTAPS